MDSRWARTFTEDWISYRLSLQVSAVSPILTDRLLDQAKVCTEKKPQEMQKKIEDLIHKVLKF